MNEPRQYDEKAIRRVAEEGESEEVEFKLKLPPEHVVGQLVSAFANSRGGTLFVGISDKHEIVGIPEPELDAAYQRMKTIMRSVMPRHAWASAKVNVDGRWVMYVSVPSAPDHQRPVRTSRGEAFRRVGEAIVPLDATPAPRRFDHGRLLRVFVAMSFREEEEPALVDYWEAMRRAAAAVNAPLEMRRIDLQEGDYEISQELMAEIDKADIIIADFTLNSRNVYFELGYARGKNKRVIQTARQSTALEFDIRNWRTLFYRNATDLERKLVAALQDAYNSVAAG